jgi:DNA repair photolyase
MPYKDITCRSLLKRITTEDLFFKGNYCLDPYQNCEFGCLYCDSSLDKTIYVKTNAAEILDEELQHVEQGVIILGHAHDPYQKIEEKHRVTRKLLGVIKKHGFSCHILTKSSLVVRDINILSKMKSMVTISVTSLNTAVTDVFEKNVPSTRRRLQTVETLVEHGVEAGVALIPILPYIVDDELEEIIKNISMCKAQYMLYKHLELKGDQKRVFFDVMQRYFPHLISKYNQLYCYCFRPGGKYMEKINREIERHCKKYKLHQEISTQKNLRNI